jgi:hypothetical protein
LYPLSCFYKINIIVFDNDGFELKMRKYKSEYNKFVIFLVKTYPGIYRHIIYNSIDEKGNKIKLKYFNSNDENAIRWARIKLLNKN